MQNIFKQMVAIKSGDTTNETVNEITVTQFLGLEPGTAYCTPEKIIKYGKSLRDEEAQQFDQLFQNFKAGNRMTGALIKRTDRGNRSYVMVNFLQLKGNVGLKVIVEDQILQLITDYREGKIAINFTLEELIEAALNH